MTKIEIVEEEEMVTPMRSMSISEARKTEGLKAYKEFMKFLTKSEIKNIEKSVKEFHSNFKIG